jgi:hypothetical protein
MMLDSGCTVVRFQANGLPAEVDCPSNFEKVTMLDNLAWHDARYDRRIRKLARLIVRTLPDTRPETIGRAIHRAVLGRVRYVGEGIDDFQKAWDTWEFGLGDCDDSARLVAALARSVGVKAEIVGFLDPSGEPRHVAARVAGRWADASLPTAYGEHPRAALSRARRTGAPTRNVVGARRFPMRAQATQAADPSSCGSGARCVRASSSTPARMNRSVMTPASAHASQPLQMRPATSAAIAPLASRAAVLARQNPPNGLGDLDAIDPSRQETRAVLSAAWDRVPGLPPKTNAALQMVQAIAKFEGGNGEGCWHHCAGVCHNWGAVQMPGSPTTHDGSEPTCPAGSAPCVDTHPTADGGDVSFGVCFKTYDSRDAGAEDYLRTLILRSADTAAQVGSGNADAMAKAMYASHYFGGHGATAEQRIDGYAEAIARNAGDVAASLDEAVLVKRGNPDAAPGAMPLASGVLLFGGLSVLGWWAVRQWKKRQRRGG